MLKICAAVALFATCAFAGDTRVADAAMREGRAAVQALIGQKADVNAAQGDGMTALHWAASQDDLAMARMLLQAGANVKAVTRINQQTPLFFAAKNGNADMVKLLLAAGADADAVDARDTTPLMLAAGSGNADAVAALIAHGAQVNAREGAHGQTALMFAAALDREAAIRVLLAHGADPGVATRVVKLGCGSVFGQDGCAPVDQNGEPITAERPAGGRGGARTAERAPAPPADPRADQAALDALAKAMGLKPAEIRRGPDDDLRASIAKLSAKVDELEKRLPGGNAAANGRPRFQRARATAMGGMTALLFAARQGQMAAAKALLEGGADINQVSGADQTSPLVEAILNGHLDLAKFLIDWGADPNAANEFGLTPLYATIDVQWAPKSWFPQPITTEEHATYLGLMIALLDDGANPNARLGKKLWFRTFGDHSWVDTAGATAFWRAAQATDLTAMKLLVARGADPNIANSAGDSALMVASGLGWAANFSLTAAGQAEGDQWIEAAAKFCIEHGADVNAADDRGYTALHGAAYIGDNDLIQYLIDKGADIKAVAKDKNTVADMANGPTRFGIPHPETVAFAEKLGSANSHNCRSDQCLVAPQPDRRRGGGQR